MVVAHKIALDPNNVQITYFTKAAGVARKTNLDETGIK